MRYIFTSSAAASALPEYDGSCFAGMLVMVLGGIGLLLSVKASAMYSGYSPSRFTSASNVI